VQPDWSPHGERIVFWALRGEGGIRDLATIPAAGGEAVWVTDDAAFDWNPVWSPDGAWLYFASDRGGSMNLWRVSIDEASGRALGEAEPLTTPSSSLGSFSISREGGKLVYSHQDERTSVGRAPFDPSTSTLTGEVTPVLESGFPFTFLDPSPDGRRLALSAYGSINDLFVANSDGTGLERLTEESAKNRGARWAADGGSLVFYSDRSGSYQCWRIRPDGSGLEQLTDFGRAMLWPAISPDGRLLLAADVETGTALFDLTGPLPAREALVRPTLDDPDLVFFGNAWSPDGTWVVAALWSKKTQSNIGIAVYTLAEDRIDTVYRSRPGLETSAPYWMPDGDSIHFVAELVSGEGALMLIDQTGGSPREVWRFPSFEDTTVRLSSDSRSLFILATSRSADLWLATFE
jgi:Tol biopolymer transport system component